MKRPCAIVALLLCCCLAAAQVLSPIAWQVKVEEQGGGEAEVVFTATLDAGWHLYSQHTDPSGPQPTVFTFRPNANYELRGKVEERTTPAAEYDEMFGCVVKSFVGKAEFRQNVSALSAEPFVLEGSIGYQLCGAGMCIAPDEYEFRVSLAGKPKVAEQVAGSRAVETADVADSDSILLSSQEDADSITTGIDLPASAAPSAPKHRSWLAYFLLALGAGVLTMFTPCVFPMIPMTVNYFLRSSESHRKGRRQAWLFGLSIVAIFAVIGVVLAALFGPEVLGIIATHWLPNLLFFAIFMLFALSFFGLFELRLPARWVNRADS